MLYGYYYKTIKRVSVEESCVKCSARSLQYCDVMCRVNHIMYIPCLPSDKMIVRKCDVCGATFDIGTEDASKEILKETKYPKLYYAAPVLFLLTIVVFIIGDYIEKKEKKKELINSVVIGYTIIEKKGDYYTSMLIMDISNDTIFVRENTQQTKGDIYSINEMKYYDTEIKPYTRDQLQRMIDDDIVTDIVPTTLMLEVEGSDFYNDSIR